MMALLRHWTAAAAVVAALAVWGCGGAPLAIEPIDSNQDPKALAAQLEQQIAQARADQVDVLSPTWFKRARDSYAAARQKLTANAPAGDILKQIAVARAELQQAEVITIRSHDQLAEAIDSRNAARNVNAQQFEDYPEVEQDFLKLTRAMENEEFEYARKRRTEVSERYRALELRAIELSAVKDVRGLLQTAADAKVPEVAPKTYLQAQEALRSAEAFIGANRYDQAGIDAKAQEARFLAQRTFVIAQAAGRLAQMPPEDIALWMETFLFQATRRLQTEDRRNMSFEEQQGAILAAMDDLRATLTLAQKSAEDKSALIQKMSDRLAEIEGTAQEIRLDKERLVAEKRYNDMLIRVQQSFDAREADVQIAPDQVTIRLKGIRFPVGGAAVQEADYGLLGKVQQAIQTFGAPLVVIEGHTDSTGSPENNLTLSRQRAESVKQFLLERYTLPKENISAVGHGAARPIATDDTAAGRAQNRRIDVIIKPQREALPAS